MLTQEEFNYSMKDRMEKLEQGVSNISTKLDKIYDKMLGDDLNPQGLLEVVEKYEARIKILEEFKNKITWTIGVCTTIGIIIGYIIQTFISK